MAELPIVAADDAADAVAQSATAYADTRTRAMVGVRFMMLRQGVILAMSAVGTTLLIRRIGPATWGGFGTGYMLLVGFDAVLSHSLIAGLLRQDVRASERLVASAARLCLIAGAGLSLLLLALPFVIVSLYAPPHFGMLLAATAVCVLLYAGRSLPLTMLERRLSYGLVAGAEIADMTVFYI